MKGAILGDIIGSVYEFNNIATKAFPLFSKRCEFTDDTVMTCAVAQSLISCNRDYDALTPELITKTLQTIGRRYPDAGYGARFIHWVFADHPQPYNSFGNGSAMRISPVGLAAQTLDEAKDLATRVSAVSHNHEEGIKGAVCIAECMVMLKQGADKEAIRSYVEGKYYQLDKTCEDYRTEQAGHHGREICQVSVPQAIICFLESTDFEDCMRNCISIGGDSDTIAAIAGGLAEAFYGVPDELWAKGEKYLDDYLRSIVSEFYAKFGVNRLVAGTPVY